MRVQICTVMMMPVSQRTVRTLAPIPPPLSKSALRYRTQLVVPGKVFTGDVRNKYVATGLDATCGTDYVCRRASVQALARDLPLAELQPVPGKVGQIPGT